MVSFIFLKNSVESTSFISQHVQIECLQEPELATTDVFNEVEKQKPD